MSLGTEKKFKAGILLLKILLANWNLNYMNIPENFRTARTLTGGENVGLIDIYDVNREELKIGPLR